MYTDSRYIDRCILILDIQIDQYVYTDTGHKDRSVCVY